MSDPIPPVQCAKGLPICSLWDELVEAIRANQLIIVTGETGSGKTTQLPKACLAAGRGKKGIIGCCQPRRIAAVSVSKRVEQELGPSAKGLVGFQIRFNHKLEPQTRIKFMTDGILLAEVQRDPLLRAYDTIILDEAHERNINVDLLAGILKRLFKRRKELKAIITSATLEVDKFLEFFDNPPLLEVPGRSYPVEVIYEKDAWYRQPRETELEEKVAVCCQMIRDTDPFGNILVFLPTEKHIFNTKRLLLRRLEDECQILPLFGRLPSSKQSVIFRPSKKQKIILATNIAETSITVPGIRYVIDSGLARISLYNVNTHLKALPVARISKANAMQRTGRAGRVQKGLCIRLYKEEDFEAMDDFLAPEIKRCNLAEVILKILNMSLVPVQDFPFIDPPKPAAIKEGMHTLFELGYVTKDGGLTALGKKAARLPIDPRLSRMLFQAKKEGCLKEIMVIVSALSIQDIWTAAHELTDSQGLARSRELHDDSSDFITLLKVWNNIQRLKSQGATKGQIKRFCTDYLLSYQRIMEWQDIYNQVQSICSYLKITRGTKNKANFETDNKDYGPLFRQAIHKSVLAGLLGHAAQKKDNGPGYKGAKGKELFIFPGSCLFKKGPQWMVSAEQVRTSRIFARTVAPIKPEWIEELAPHLCKYHYFEPKWSSKRGEAVIKEKVNFYGMTIVAARNRSLKKIDKKLARRIFIEQGLSTCELRFEYPFNMHNKAILEEIEELEQKKRSPFSTINEELLFDFFEKAISRVEERTGTWILDEHTLRRTLKKYPKLDKELRLKRGLFLEKRRNDDTERMYPGFFKAGGQKLPLVYRFNPGGKDDGILVKIPLVLLPYLNGEPFEWLVPGFLQEKILFILKNLPKNIRKGLEPIDQTAKVAFDLLDFGKGSLRDQLAVLIGQRLSVDLQKDDLMDEKHLPLHLSMSFEIVDKDGRACAKGKDLDVLKERLKLSSEKALRSWREFLSAAKGLERPVFPNELSSFPKEIELGAWAEIPILGFPGISAEEDTPFIRLFLSKELAKIESEKGLKMLLQISLKKEIKQVKKLIHESVSEAFGPIVRAFPLRAASIKKEMGLLKEKLLVFVLERHLPTCSRIPSKSEFDQMIRAMRKGLVTGCYSLLNTLDPSIREYAALMMEEESVRLRAKRSKAILETLDSVSRIRTVLMACLLEPRSQEDYIFHVPRYLKTLKVRINRAENEPQKDVRKQQKFDLAFQKYINAFEIMTSGHKKHHGLEASFYQFQEQVFEFMVSVFAPELAVRNRFSQKKLSHFLQIYSKAL